MNELILIGKVVSLFIAVAFGAIWLMQAVRGHAIAEVQTYVASAGIVGFVTLQWLI